MSLERPVGAPKGISELKAIEESFGREFTTREEIRTFVEAPLVKACEMFWDKNIRTLSSSGNAKDIERGYAYIVLDYDHLSAGNQDIARELGEISHNEETQTVQLRIPVSAESKIGDIEQESLRVSSRFNSQPATWIKGFTLEQMREICATPKDETLTLEELGSHGWYYDQASGLFFMSKELFEKTRA